LHAILNVEQLLNFFEHTLNDVKREAMSDSLKGGGGRQDRIVHATVELLLELGLRATTTRAVTERAGVGTGLLNHYFRWPELRALAWGRIFEAVARDQFPPDLDPQATLEHYFATAFSPDAHQFWHLWSEGADLAASDDAIKDAVEVARSRLHGGLLDILVTGCGAELWHLPDPQGTALRLGALYDGLASLLLSSATGVTAEQAEAHLRKAFQLETGLY
jgi:AcrR family transcriptional regulator